jgi:RNA polymerase sigma-70 factor, ECF subfamily
MAQNDRPTPDARAFETLLAGVLEVAYGVAYHLTHSRDDAEDLVQEAALQAYRNFHQFETGTNFKAWYLRILTHCCYALYRKRRRQPQISLEDASPLHLNLASLGAGIGATHSDPATLVISRLGEERVSQAIGELPEEFRVVCTLYFMNDASYQEIAEILECPVGTVRSRLHRGRRMLQKALWCLAEEQGIVTALTASEGTS